MLSAFSSRLARSAAAGTLRSFTTTRLALEGPNAAPVSSIASIFTNSTKPAARAATAAATTTKAAAADSVGAYSTGERVSTRKTPFSSSRFGQNRGKRPLFGANSSALYGVVDSVTAAPRGQFSHIMHVQCSPNNTIISLSDSKGNVLLTRSGGTAGFKKAQRSGFEAAYQALVQVASSVKEKGVVVNTLHLKLKGFGQGRDAVFKAITATTNWNIKRITDCTPLPFNGPRPKKKRRL